MELNKDKLTSLINNEVTRLTDSIEPVKVKTTEDILQELIKNIGKIDFSLLAFPDINDVKNQIQNIKVKVYDNEGKIIDKEALKELNELERKLNSYKVSKNHYLILCIEQLLKIAKSNNWGLCGKNGQIDHHFPVQIDHRFRCKLTTTFQSKLTT
jgi:putative DNA primase/helicase